MEVKEGGGGRKGTITTIRSIDENEYKGGSFHCRPQGDTHFRPARLDGAEPGRSPTLPQTRALSPKDPPAWGLGPSVMLSQGSNLFSRVICFSAELTLCCKPYLSISLSELLSLPLHGFLLVTKMQHGDRRPPQGLRTSDSTHVSVSAVPPGPRPWPARYTPLPE